LPEPPTIEQLVQNSDLIIKATILHSGTYSIGDKTIGQSRLKCVKSYKISRLFALSPGDEFTVTYYVHKDEIGPFFSEPPQPGDYLVFLSLRNVHAGNLLFGYVAEFIYPDPFSLYEPDDKIEKKLSGK